jgi:hypothetical protein
MVVETEPHYALVDFGVDAPAGRRGERREGSRCEGNTTSFAAAAAALDQIPGPVTLHYQPARQLAHRHGVGSEERRLGRWVVVATSLGCPPFVEVPVHICAAGSGEPGLGPGREEEMWACQLVEVWDEPVRDILAAEVG